MTFFNTIKYRTYLLILLSATIFFTACDDDDDNSKVVKIEANASETSIQEALINAENESTIEFAAGTYAFTNTLSMDGKTGVRIVGAGQNATILDFSGQTAGAEGVLVTNVNQFLIANLTVRDTEGDGIKVKDSDGVSFINVTAEWTGEANEDNGAYGLYPVLCSNVWMDGCTAKGASDAGIYVGQCTDAIVANSTATENVAGIEVENTQRAEVYGCTATKNTGGILVFDLPGLTMNGSHVRVYNNTVVENDYRNFGPEGSVLAEVPPGTGILVMSSRDVEVFGNTITNNNTMGLGVVSYDILGELSGNSGGSDDPNYNSIVANIHIHDNTFSRTNNYPADVQGTTAGILFSTTLFADANVPDIIIDGVSATDSNTDNSENICIHDNVNADFVNIDGGNGFNNFNRDVSVHNCTPESLTGVTVDAPTL